MNRQREAEEMMRRLLARLSPADRLRMCARMFHTARVLAMSGIRSELGTVSPDVLRRALLLRFYGRDLTEAQLEDILAHSRLSGL